MTQPLQRVQEPLLSGDSQDTPIVLNDDELDDKSNDNSEATLSGGKLALVATPPASLHDPHSSLSVDSNTPHPDASACISNMHGVFSAYEKAFGMDSVKQRSGERGHDGITHWKRRHPPERSLEPYELLANTPLPKRPRGSKTATQHDARGKSKIWRLRPSSSRYRRDRYWDVVCLGGVHLGDDGSLSCELLWAPTILPMNRLNGSLRKLAEDLVMENYGMEVAEAPNVFSIVLKDNNPVWFYCAQGNHCRSGMSGIINQNFNSPNTLAAYKLKAKNTTTVIPLVAGAAGFITPNKPL
ncbi:hypothetical protein K469DRAFT_688049 [Zopfia rhizophila CBS 207.26]|uniref:Uncharacterized protein n=1 Tax=Zopfia rhizophila CBS 207.26 TaxID=1314779 RepID=A0A6A6E1Z6_9PEZI|nr:hypothetical protein K469DRAFT_688049 [Zopfia rhizophila CBS 207.26]